MHSVAALQFNLARRKPIKAQQQSVSHLEQNLKFEPPAVAEKQLGRSRACSTQAAPLGCCMMESSLCRLQHKPARVGHLTVWGRIRPTTAGEDSRRASTESPGTRLPGQDVVPGRAQGDCHAAGEAPLQPPSVVQESGSASPRVAALDSRLHIERVSESHVERALAMTQFMTVAEGGGNRSRKRRATVSCTVLGLQLPASNRVRTCLTAPSHRAAAPSLVGCRDTFPGNSVCLGAEVLAGDRWRLHGSVDALT